MSPNSGVDSRRHDWRCRAINLDLSWHAPTRIARTCEPSPRGPNTEWLNGRLQLIAGFARRRRCRPNDYGPPTDLSPPIISDACCQYRCLIHHWALFLSAHQNSMKSLLLTCTCILRLFCTLPKANVETNIVKNITHTPACFFRFLVVNLPICTFVCMSLSQQR